MGVRRLGLRTRPAGCEAMLGGGGGRRTAVRVRGVVHRAEVRRGGTGGLRVGGWTTLGRLQQ